jgi:hypothetical protein
MSPALGTPMGTAMSTAMGTVLRHWCVGATAIGLVVALAACGGGSGAKPAPNTSTRSVAGALVATRWWSNSAATTGSRINPDQPGAVAAKLHPSQSEYCQMLSQTLAAGKSILPGATASDPALLTSTEAFVAEVQRVAPASVHSQWQVVGDAIVGFVKSTGSSVGKSAVSTTTLTSDVAAISADAKQNCHLDLTAKAAAH